MVPSTTRGCSHWAWNAQQLHCSGAYEQTPNPLGERQHPSQRLWPGPGRPHARVSRTSVTVNASATSRKQTHLYNDEIAGSCTHFARVFRREIVQNPPRFTPQHLQLRLRGDSGLAGGEVTPCSGGGHCPAHGEGRGTALQARRQHLVNGPTHHQEKFFAGPS